MSQTINVLSIDGGGIRGLVPGLLLAEIEARTGKPIWQLFDLIAGTSTGGILALGLTVPDASGKVARYTAVDAVKLYTDQGGRIFSRDVWQRIRTAGGLLDDKYPADEIEKVLTEYFGEAHLKDALTDVLVTSYEIEQRYAFLFKSWKARGDATRDFLMRNVARATSAAPTYFEPEKIDVAPPGPDYYALIDGGVYANNPAMCAYVEARAAANTLAETDVLVVSLGTGELTRRLPYDQARHWGVAHWARPVLNVVFHGVSSTIDYQLRTLLAHDRYYRFEERLDSASEDMDNASPENMHLLKQLAAKIISERSADLDSVCAQLASGTRMDPFRGATPRAAPATQS